MIGFHCEYAFCQQFRSVSGLLWRLLTGSGHVSRCVRVCVRVIVELFVGNRQKQTADVVHALDAISDQTTAPSCKQVTTRV